MTIPSAMASNVTLQLVNNLNCAADPKPSDPLIDKRVTELTNPCAVAGTKSDLHSIGVGSPLYKALLILPRFPSLLPGLAYDIATIVDYLQGRWQGVSKDQLVNCAEFWYLLRDKHAMFPLNPITENTIFWYDLEGSAPKVTAASTLMVSTTQTKAKSCPSNTFTLTEDNTPSTTTVVSKNRSTPVMIEN